MSAQGTLTLTARLITLYHASPRPIEELDQSVLAYHVTLVDFKARLRQAYDDKQALEEGP